MFGEREDMLVVLCDKCTSVSNCAVMFRNSAEGNQKESRAAKFDWNILYLQNTA